MSEQDEHFGLDDLGEVGDTVAQPVKKKRRRKLWGFLTLALVILLIPVAVAGFYAGNAYKAIDNVERQDLLPNVTTDDAPPPPVTATSKDTINFVLMGSDSRGAGDGGRSDVLMVAHLDEKREKAYLISFPRDMWVEVPGYNKAKINAAYAFGGPKLTARTLQNLTGVQMDHAAQINFEGFIGLTEALGGVTVNNRVASQTQGYSWAQGPITIQGAEALAYVRQRKELPNGDLDRAERQRAVVRAIVSKLMDGGLLKDPVKFQRVAGQLSGFFVVDNGLDNSTMIKMATSLKLRSGSDIKMLQAPIAKFGTSPDGQSIDVVDEAQMAELAKALQDDTMDAYYEKYKGQAPVKEG